MYLKNLTTNNQYGAFDYVELCYTIKNSLIILNIFMKKSAECITITYSIKSISDNGVM